MKEGTEFFDIIFLTPGLESKVKIDSRVSCRTALMLAMLVEQALVTEGPVKKLLSAEDVEGIKGLVGDILAKGKLGPLYERLRR